VFHWIDPGRRGRKDLRPERKLAAEKKMSKKSGVEAKPCRKILVEWVPLKPRPKSSCWRRTSQAAYWRRRKKTGEDAVCSAPRAAGEALAALETRVAMLEMAIAGNDKEEKKNAGAAESAEAEEEGLTTESEGWGELLEVRGECAGVDGMSEGVDNPPIEGTGVEVRAGGRLEAALDALSRKELQLVAKVKGVRANGESEGMRLELIKAFEEGMIEEMCKAVSEAAENKEEECLDEQDLNYEGTDAEVRERYCTEDADEGEILDDESEGCSICYERTRDNWMAGCSYTCPRCGDEWMVGLDEDCKIHGSCDCHCNYNPHLNRRRYEHRIRAWEKKKAKEKEAAQKEGTPSK